MKLVKNFVLVVLHMIGSLWMGIFNRKPDFYDQYTQTKTRAGYIVFVTLSAVVSITVIAWLYNQLS